MTQIIPGPLLALCAEIAASRETHATLDNLFTHAGAVGDPPVGNKLAKAQAWLRATNKDKTTQPLQVLGRIIENYMDLVYDLGDPRSEYSLRDRESLAKTIAQCGLHYIRGGKIVGSLGVGSRSLEEFIRERDVAAIDLEFDRSLSNVESNPREAVSAASNILESFCKIYIHDECLEMPAKQDLKPVWAIVRKHLGLDPSIIVDQDLQTILTGLIATVEGIGALRTHASSAHGAGRTTYKLEPRHARLAVHAAHTVTLFMLESWGKKKTSVTIQSKAATPPVTNHVAPVLQ